MNLKILEHFKTLDEKDFTIISAIEQLMVNFNIIKIEDIAKMTGFSIKFLNKKISYLDKIDILSAHRIEDSYSSVELNYMGYDALAVNELVKRDVLLAIGNPIGIGKESNVFTGILSNETPCALKFHKIGKTKFKATKRKREFIANKRHISKLYESTINAKREVIALKKLAGIIPVPQVYGYNRHLIVMELIEGVELQNVNDINEDAYKSIYTELMGYVKTMINFNIIHGDFSPFNILIREENESIKLTIIDWPQFVELTHPNALDILATDVNNIYTFFNKKFKLEPFDIEKFCKDLIKEAKKNLHIGD